MVLGLPYGGVAVVESDPSWAVAAAELTERVGSVLGELAVVVEHVGSTSVPGLPAKPIIDVAVELAPDTDVDRVVPFMQNAGFIYRGYRESVGDWLFHRVVDNELCTAIIHVVSHGAPGMGRWIAVRDRLRSDPAVRVEYARLKEMLAEEYPDDRESYSRGKVAFLEDLLRSMLP